MKSEISRLNLNWSTVNIQGSKQTNKPGGLAYLAGLVSKTGGNIIRTVHNTSSDGSFSLRLVLAGIDEVGREKLAELFRASQMDLDKVEIV